MTKAFPRAVIDKILAETDRGGVRRRKLPGYLMVYYVIALGLMVSVSAREVLRRLLDQVRDDLSNGAELIASRAAICKARQRLGVEPIRELFERVVGPIAKRATKGAWFGGLRLVALDGSSLNLQDTPANREAYGKAPAAGKTTSPLPLIRFVALCEIGTHVLFAVRMAAWKISEVALAKQLIHRLEPGMLCLADRLFYGFVLWNEAVATGVFERGPRAFERESGRTCSPRPSPSDRVQRHRWPAPGALPGHHYAARSEEGSRPQTGTPVRKTMGDRNGVRRVENVSARPGCFTAQPTS